MESDLVSTGMGNSTAIAEPAKLGKSQKATANGSHIVAKKITYMYPSPFYLRDDQVLS